LTNHLDLVDVNRLRNISSGAIQIDDLYLFTFCECVQCRSVHWGNGCFS